MSSMFAYSKFNGDISKWNTLKVRNMYRMCQLSQLNKDISNWKISKDCNVDDMFYECPIKDEFKPKLLK